MHERASKRRKVDSKSTAQSDSVPGFAKWDIEQDYEKRARKPGKKNEKDSNKLPVKSEQSGKWEQDTSRPDEDSDSVEGSDEDDEGDSAVADLQTTQAETVVQRPRLPPKEEKRQAQEELARIASLLHENPEEHIGLLTSLSQLGKSPNTTVQKLALGTQYAIYKDIIPGYRIRSLTKEDAAAKLSKDVRQLRNVEQGLVHGYREYVQTLSRLAEPGKKTADASIASIAIACASNLLTSGPHFNFRTELITILVKKLSTRAQDDDSAKALAALEQLFRTDEEGHAALEAVIQLTKMMKSKAYFIHSSVLNSFLHLRLLSEFAHKASTTQIEKGEREDSGQYGKKPQPKKKDRQFRTKRTRKLLRENASIAAEMKEADAVVSHEERDKNQAEMLKAVFVTYFRILKAGRDLPRGRAGDLLPTVLEGLARYAHLINWEFFGDLVEVLREVITESEGGSLEQATTTDGEEPEEANFDARGQRNATRESLLCVITAFALLQGQQDVAKSAHTLNLDLNFFTNTLYRSLLPLSLDADIEGDIFSTASTSPNQKPPTPTEANSSWA